MTLNKSNYINKDLNHLSDSSICISIKCHLNNSIEIKLNDIFSMLNSSGDIDFKRAESL